MKLKNTPTIEYLSESVFKNFVRFETDKVVLKDSCPKELAIIFYYMEPSDKYIIIIWIKLMIIYWKRKKSLNKNLKKKILIYQDFQDMMKHFAE